MYWILIREVRALREELKLFMDFQFHVLDSQVAATLYLASKTEQTTFNSMYWIHVDIVIGDGIDVRLAFNSMYWIRNSALSWRARACGGS